MHYNTFLHVLFIALSVETKLPGSFFLYFMDIGFDFWGFHLHLIGFKYKVLYLNDGFDMGVCFRWMGFCCVISAFRFLRLPTFTSRGLQELRLWTSHASCRFKMTLVSFRYPFCPEIIFLAHYYGKRRWTKSCFKKVTCGKFRVIYL